MRSGVVGQPSYNPTTKEIIAQKKQTSDVTSQVHTYACKKNLSLRSNISRSYLLGDLSHHQNYYLRYVTQEAETRDNMNDCGEDGEGSGLLTVNLTETFDTTDLKFKYIYIYG